MMKSLRKEELEEFNKLAQPVLDWLKNGAPHTHAGSIFNMNYVHHPVEKMPFLRDANNSCGSAMCIAGAIGEFNKFSDLDKSDHILKGKFDMISSDLEALFYPQDLDNYHDITPEDAAEVLEHFMKTGEVIWEDYTEKYRDC